MDGLRVGRRAVATFVMVLRMVWTAGTISDKLVSVGDIESEGRAQASE